MVKIYFPLFFIVLFFFSTSLLNAQNIGIGEASPNTRLEIKGNGIYETYNRRFKIDIQPLENAMDKVHQLNVVSYYYRADEFPYRKFDSQQDLGVIAQELEKILPQVVATAVEGYRSVHYSHLVPLLIEALKEQEKVFNEKLAEKDTELNKQVEKLKALSNKINKIESYLQENAYDSIT